eukprot:scaffold176073_cov32-Tisochrysis_lutea.AAC.2
MEIPIQVRREWACTTSRPRTSHRMCSSEPASRILMGSERGVSADCSLSSVEPLILDQSEV